MSGSLPDSAHQVLLGQHPSASCHRKYSVHNLGAASSGNSQNDESLTRKGPVCRNFCVKQLEKTSGVIKSLDFLGYSHKHQFNKTNNSYKPNEKWTLFNRVLVVQKHKNLGLEVAFSKYQFYIPEQEHEACSLIVINIPGIKSEVIQTFSLT